MAKDFNGYELVGNGLLTLLCFAQKASLRFLISEIEVNSNSAAGKGQTFLPAALRTQAGLPI